jgi:hypothetical protein
MIQIRLNFVVLISFCDTYKQVIRNFKPAVH